MKVAVIGSRGLNVDIDKYIPNGIEVLISGGAKGIDRLAEAWADEHNIQKLIIKPDYIRYGKNAPLVRDKEIVKQSDMVVAIWDGESRGTKFTVDYAKQINKPVEVYIIK